MKRWMTTWLSVLACSALMACAHKQPTQELVGFVMDSTQALLAGAQVTIGKTTITTSWDGRFIFKADQWTSNATLTVTCKGFEKQTLSLSKQNVKQPLLVALTPQKRPKGKDEEHAYGGAVRGVFYCKTADVTADYAVAELAVEEDAMIEPAMMHAESGATYSHTANNISAGRLTAGEVNDFTKWYFWPKVVDGSHKEFVDTWKIDPRQRYTVQVVNKEGYPVVNYPVSLKCGNNTLFQAVTDNTGKAELWGNLITSNPKTMVEVPERTIVVDEPCESPEGVDVVFVFDATGSMGDELHYLQAEMKDVIARAAEATGGLSIRTGAVVYRDHGDEYVTRISRLTNDITTTQAFIDKQHANGGGDFPEAVPEALMAAMNSAGWDESARARIAFLVLDAPCHQDSATIALLHEQILNAAALGVRIVPVVCSGLDKAGELLMRSIALATNGTSFFLTDDSGIGHKHLKPTTDSLKVEHLNDMLVRTIVEFSAMPSCKEFGDEGVNELEDGPDEQFVPNPFDAKELEQDPTIPHGAGTLYILDVSGKLITIINASADDLTAAELKAKGLPIGIYFIKTYVDGQWYTRKILVY